MCIVRSLIDHKIILKDIELRFALVSCDRLYVLSQYPRQIDENKDD